MKMKIIVLYDIVAEEAGMPYYARTLGEAQRITKAFLKKEDHPDDYRPYYIGEYDTNTMLVFCNQKPEIITLNDNKSIESEEN